MQKNFSIKNAIKISYSWRPNEDEYLHWERWREMKTLSWRQKMDVQTWKTKITLLATFWTRIKGVHNEMKTKECPLVKFLTFWKKIFLERCLRSYRTRYNYPRVGRSWLSASINLQRAPSWPGHLHGNSWYVAARGRGSPRPELKPPHYVRRATLCLRRESVLRILEVMSRVVLYNAHTPGPRATEPTYRYRVADEKWKCRG